MIHLQKNCLSENIMVYSDDRQNFQVRGTFEDWPRGKFKGVRDRGFRVRQWSFSRDDHDP